MNMPLIGISGSMNDAEGQIFLVRAYMKSILDAGGMPVLLSPDMADCHLADCLRKLDGVLLAGGGDVVPEHFGEAAIPELGETTPVRDHFELRLIAGAIKQKLPVLGICRGIQVMNVALGGTLYQDLKTQFPAKIVPLLGHQQTKPYEEPTHSVTIEKNSLLHQLTGEDILSVNSMHHQAIKTVAPELHISAFCSDGVAEAAEHINLPFFLGVQWHPERLNDSSSRRLFRAFVHAAANYREGQP